MKTIRGVTLIELMIGLSLGLIVSLAFLGVYLAQTNIYRTNLSQAAIQDAENAISALLSPVIRSAGFCGCTTISQAVSNLNLGGPPPLGNLGTTQAAIMGYDAAAGTTITITQDNAANSMNANNWTPAFDASLVGNVQSTSDVLIILGAAPGAQPIAVTTITSGSNSMTLQNATGIVAGQFGVVSDCLKASVFKITNVTGTTITHASGVGALANASDALTPNYSPGAQFIPLTQFVFFVAHDPAGQSALVRGTLSASGTWNIQSLVPGVETMQILYGIGTNGILTEYVPAGTVANWTQVYAIRLGFVIEGGPGSASSPPTQYSVLGTTIHVPADGRLRHTFEMTITLRNLSS